MTEEEWDAYYNEEWDEEEEEEEEVKKVPKLNITRGEYYDPALMKELDDAIKTYQDI